MYQLVLTKRDQPFPHEKYPLISEEAQARQARETEKR